MSEIEAAKPELNSSESPVAAPEGTKLEVVRIEKRPEESLAVIVGRQNCEYYTEPAWPETDALTKPVTYVTRCDGVWEIRNNAVGIFCVKKADAKFPGFPKEDNCPWFVNRHGAIPYERLQEILYFFKSICDESKDEVYMQIFWNEEEQCYFNYCPKQKVSGASVEYDRDPELEDKHVLVLEIHSHNTMGAYFSSVDDADEKGDRFFGVVGELNKFKPAMEFSYVCGGKRQKVTADQIFTEAPEEHQLFPQEWRGRVTKRNATTYGGGQYSNYQGTYYKNQAAEAQGTHQGPYSHQGLHDNNHGFSHGRRTWGSQPSGSSTTTTTGKSKTEIEKEIEQAANKAKAEIDTSLKSRDFLNDTPSEPEVPVVPFSRAVGEGGIHTAEVDTYDEIIEAIVGQIEETFLQHYVTETKMSDHHKEELFNSLIASLSEADAETIIQCLAQHGYQELMIEAAGAYDASEPGDARDCSEK